MSAADSLTNPDLAPVPPSERRWTLWSMAALWVGMAVQIPTYMMAASLINNGLSWWQALGIISVANLIVLVPIALNSHPGTKYGIPFPVLVRASFGTFGANIPALMRALVACGWFGIQTAIGGSALYGIAAALMGGDPWAGARLPYLEIAPGPLVAFLVFWAINVAVIVRGIESVRWLEIVSAPFLLLVGLALLAWAWWAAGGFGPLFRESPRLETPAEFWKVFLPALTANVGFWATLSLNIPDFSRYARSQRDQVLGQAIGLPGTMALFAFIGIAVTSATVVVYGEAIWDPVVLLGRFENKAVVVVGLVALLLATLSTNIAANVVSPANDFANLAPRWISFRTGGLITAVLGVAMRPWVLLADPTAYVFTWLIGYGALLGPIAGIMIADYYVVRRRRLDVEDLYRPDGAYRYIDGVSSIALIVLFLGILPNVPGFLVDVQWAKPRDFPAWLTGIYHYSWFVGFGLAFLLYIPLRKLAPTR